MLHDAELTESSDHIRLQPFGCSSTGWEIQVRAGWEEKLVASSQVWEVDLRVASVEEKG